MDHPFIGDLPPSPRISDIQGKIDGFLVGPMAESLRSVDYRFIDYDQPPIPISEAARAHVQIAHASGSPQALYLVNALHQQLRMQIQLNVYRLVIVYSIPQSEALDADALRARFSRWELGANHAGWNIGWRDAVDAENAATEITEIYCYAMLPWDFLESDAHQLYWMNDIVQMTRALFLEARRISVRLS
jgi:hypothetical protein